LQKAAKLLAEQSDSLRIKLSDTLGAAFTDDILAKIKTGEITTAQALDAINKKSKEAGLNVTQQAELTKELFGKSGIAAGGFAVILDTVTGGLKKQKEESNANQKALDDLEIAYVNLGTAQSQLFRVKDFGELWTGIKAKVADAFASFLTGIAEFKNNIQPLIDLVGVVLVNAWYSLKMSVSNAFELIGGVVKIFSDNIKFSFNFIKAILTGDFVGAIDLVKNYFINLGNTVGNVFGNVKNNIINAIQGVIANVSPLLKALGLDVDYMQKKLESFKYIKPEENNPSNPKANGKNPEATTTKQTQEELDKQKAIRDAARQKEADARRAAEEKQQAEQDAKNKLFAEGEKQINQLIASESEKRTLNNLKGVDKEIQAIEFKYAKELEKFKGHKDRIKEIEATRDQEINALKLAKAAEYNVQILDIEKQLAFDKEVFRLEQESQKAVTDEEKQAILIEKARFIADYEIQSELEKELAKVENVENAEALKQAIRDKYAQKKTEVDNKMDVAEKAIKKQQVDWTEMTENQKLDAVKAALNGAADALNKGSGAWKAVKIAETTIATYQSAVNSYNSLSGIPVVGPALGAISAAFAVASGLKQIKQIASTKIEKVPKFFAGGFTGSDARLGYDEFGKMTGVVHEQEYVIPKVMTQSPRYANTIAWLEQERTGNARKFATGGATSPGIIPSGTPGAGIDQSAMLYGAIMNLNAILSNGITAKTVIGYNEAKDIQTLNDERTASTANGTLNN